MKRKFINIISIINLLCLPFIIHASEPVLQSADCGRVDRLVIYSPELNEDVIVDIWVPNEYKGSDSKRYPVIYMHDGQNLYDSSTTWNQQSWEMDSVACRLIDSGEINPPIIVGVHSHSDRRVADLMPEDAVSDEDLKTMFEGLGYIDIPVRGNAYASFLVNTLKPAIDQLYDTIPDKDHTAVMGSSMGGLMSIYAICEYPEIFGSAMCLSTHWIGNQDIVDSFSKGLYDYIDAHIPPSENHKLYLDRGTETLDAYYGEKDEMMKDLVRVHGYNNSSNFMSLIDEGGAHEERSWARRVAEPLKFFLSKSRQ